LLAEVLCNIMDELGIDAISMTICELQKVLQERGFSSLRVSETVHNWPQKLFHANEHLAYKTYVSNGKLVKEPIRTGGRYYTFVYEDLSKLLANG
jgi:hypothetical protein